LKNANGHLTRLQYTVQRSVQYKFEFKKTTTTQNKSAQKYEQRDDEKYYQYQYNTH